MIRVITRNDWPNLAWQDLPEGAKWLTVRRAPVSFIQIQEKDTPGSPIQAYVGMPMPLDPRVRYQFRNVADPAIDLFTDPTSMVAPFIWKDRRTELVVSDFPVPGGNVAFAFTCQNATPAGVAVSPVRHTSEGLRLAATTWCANGTVTFAITSVYDPLATLPNPDVRIFKALSNGIARVFPFAVCGTNLDTDDNAVAIAGRATIGPGFEQTISFPVTTTPTVTCRFAGRL